MTHIIRAPACAGCRLSEMIAQDVPRARQILANAMVGTFNGAVVLSVEFDDDVWPVNDRLTHLLDTVVQAMRNGGCPVQGRFRVKVASRDAWIVVKASNSAPRSNIHRLDACTTEAPGTSALSSAVAPP